MTVIDTVKSPPLDAMRQAGVTGVIRYLSLIEQDTVFKRITQAEYDQLRGAGFDVLLNWEYASQDWLGGSAAGADHAAKAVAQAKALGYAAGCAIVGSCDFNMTAAQWSTSGGSYARAFSQGIRAGGYRAGVYGPWDVLNWCRDLGGFSVFWQAGMSTSWSGGRNAQLWPGAHLRQRGHLTIGGQDCDWNDVLQPNYGQYAVDAATTEDDMTQDQADMLARVERIATVLCTALGWDWVKTPGAWADDANGHYLTGDTIPLPSTWAGGPQALPNPAVRLAQLVSALSTPAAVDTHALASDIAQQLVTANTNGLTDADLSAVRAVVAGVLNAKLTAAAGA